MNRARVFILLLASGCGVIPGRMAGPDELGELGDRLVDVEEMNVRGRLVTARDGEREFDGAIDRLNDAIIGADPGGDLRWGVAIPPLFSGGALTLMPLPYWWRPGRGGYVQAFPVANLAEHYFLVGGGFFDFYVARTIEDRGELIGINEYRGWLLGGLLNKTTDYRFYEEDGEVVGILKRRTWGIGPLTIRRSGEFLELSPPAPDGDYEEAGGLR